MKCPTCFGHKVIRMFPFMGSHNPDKPYVDMICYDCDGTGIVDKHYPKWKKIGERLKQARIDRRETLRNYCKRTGEDPFIRSKMERGFVKPIDKHGELKDAKL
jgi:hypothetical protein